MDNKGTETTEKGDTDVEQNDEETVVEASPKQLHSRCIPLNTIENPTPKSSMRKRKKSRDSASPDVKKRRATFSEDGPKRAKKNDRKQLVKTERSREKKHKAEKNEDDKYKEEYNKKLDCLAIYGKNFHCGSFKKRSGLRPIYIDGSNVAFSHGLNERFSVEGLKICIDYFRKRGHEVKAFVPHFRLRKGQTTNQDLLHRLVTKKLVITTPTLYIQNQQRSPYDDWYIVQSAAANGGIIVSRDNFSDIIRWNPNLRSVIEECRLVPTFVDDMIIFPVDPHGNRKNNLEQFLRF